jgi:hypothetical protein
MRTTTALMIAVALLAAACTSSSTPTTTTLSALRPLTDAELVWCHSNPYAVSQAFIVLELEGFEELTATSDKIFVENLDIADPGLVVGWNYRDEWAPNHQTAHNRACKAAFEAR